MAHAAAVGTASGVGDWGGWPEAVRPKTRIFFSCDIVGSTALKQATRKISETGLMVDNSSWFGVIQRFYIIVVDRFLANYAAMVVADAPDGAAPKPPTLWKTSGDEVLLWAELTDSRLLLRYVLAWKKTCEQVRRDLKTFNDRLDVKGTMWTAQFPWRNKMIFSSRDGSGGLGDNNLAQMSLFLSGEGEEGCDLIPDFIGPGIDIGFRLSTYATLRRFIISAETAYMMTLAAIEDETCLDFKLRFDGMHPFKGVLGGMDYPVFWIDMSDRYHIDWFERDLEQRHECDPNDVIKFLDIFFRDASNYLYHPFIVSPSERYVTTAPDWYAQAHTEMLEAAGIKPLG